MARILVTCPQQSASADSYYATVCPQVRTPTCLALSRWCLSASARLLADPGAAAPQRRAGSAAVPARGRQGRPPDGPAEAQPGAAAAAAAALLSAAALPSRARSVGLGRRPALGGAFSPLPVVSGGCPPQAAVEEWELSRCVDGVHKVRAAWCLHPTPPSVSSLVSAQLPAEAVSQVHPPKPPQPFTVPTRDILLVLTPLTRFSILTDPSAVSDWLSSGLCARKQSARIPPQSSEGSSSRPLHTLLLHPAERVPPTVG